MLLEDKTSSFASKFLTCANYNDKAYEKMKNPFRFKTAF